MFVTGHRTSDLLYRFRWDTLSGAWTETNALDAGSSLGDVLVIPDVPSLAITLDGESNSVVLAWPASATDWGVETTPALLPVATWTELTTTRETNAISILVNLPKTNDAAFFRLKAPPRP